MLYFSYELSIDCRHLSCKGQFPWIRSLQYDSIEYLGFDKRINIHNFQVRLLMYLLLNLNCVGPGQPQISAVVPEVSLQAYALFCYCAITHGRWSDYYRRRLNTILGGEVITTDVGWIRSEEVKFITTDVGWTRYEEVKCISTDVGRTRSEEVKCISTDVGWTRSEEVKCITTDDEWTRSEEVKCITTDIGWTRSEEVKCSTTDVGWTRSEEVKCITTDVRWTRS